MHIDNEEEHVNVENLMYNNISWLYLPFRTAISFSIKFGLRLTPQQKSNFPFNHISLISHTKLGRNSFENLIMKDVRVRISPRFQDITIGFRFKISFELSPGLP